MALPAPAPLTSAPASGSPATPGAAAGPSQDALLTRLLAKFESPRYTPPTLPRVAIELLQVSQRSDVRVDQLVSLLERDPMLAAHVLKLVRTAAYAGRMPIQSLKDAVVRLGLARLRDVVMEASLSVQVFRGDGYAETMEQLRQHATATAHLARLVCKHTAIHPEFAFLCGLLHDIGIAGALLTLGEMPGPRLSLAEVWPAVEAVHARASAVIVKLWKLPVEIESVVGLHHEWNAEGTTNPLGPVVCVAQLLAGELGRGLHPAELEGAGPVVCDEVSPQDAAAAIAFLELDAPRMKQLRAEAVQLLADVGLLPAELTPPAGSVPTR